MTNPWIEHVKTFAEKKGMKYNEALKHPDCKASYKKSGAGTKAGNARVGQEKGSRLAYDDLKHKKGKGIIDEMGQQQARVAFKDNDLGLGANAGASRSK